MFILWNWFRNKIANRKLAYLRQNTVWRKNSTLKFLLQSKTHFLLLPMKIKKCWVAGRKQLLFFFIFPYQILWLTQRNPDVYFNLVIKFLTYLYSSTQVFCFHTIVAFCLKPTRLDILQMKSLWHICLKKFYILK